MDKHKRNLIRALLVLLFAAVAFAATAQTQPPKPENLPKWENINVFAVVSENIETAFKEAATTLKAEEEIDSFPNQGFQIHCTLYMTQYPEGSKDQVLAKIEEFAKTTRQFPITTTGLEITSGNWFFMNLDRNRNLQTLSDAVVQLLSPLRLKSDFVPEWAKAFPNKLEYIKKFGSPNVYDEFNPHLTFLAKAEAEKLNNFLENHENSTFAKPVEGKIVGIGVGIAGRSGQVAEPWKIFELQPAEQ